MQGLWRSMNPDVKSHSFPLFLSLFFIGLLFQNSQSSAETTKPCFRCDGRGSFKCEEPGCENGKKNCPDPCLKLTEGKWEHLEVKDHSPTELWQKFVNKDDQGWQAWSQHHVGEKIEYQNAKPVSTGKCKTCGGSTKIACPKCNGRGTTICSFCDGKKVVPSSWTEQNNPKIASDPNVVRLKDGKVFRGKVTITLGEASWIHTLDGKEIEVKTDDILPQESTDKKDLFESISN